MADDKVNNKRGPDDSWESGRSKSWESPVKDLEGYRERVSNVFAKYATTIYLSTRSLPLETGDGSYVDKHSDTHKLIEALGQLPHFRTDGHDYHGVRTLKKAIELPFERKPWKDDRLYLLEDIIALGSELPLGSSASNLLTNKIVKFLWRDLDHPSLAFIPSEFNARAFDSAGFNSSLPQTAHVNLRYRTADGSYNNVTKALVGSANRPYARSVPPVTPQLDPPPDPGLIFDRLLKRQEHKPHERGISSSLFYFATIIIHDLFHTSHGDQGISETSSYLDLAPLYGNNAEEQSQVREKRGGRLRPDCFAEDRILGFPPGVSVWLIMFNRYHNHVVQNLATINEGNRFDPSSDTLDEDLFQTGRLVTCGLYMHIILNDYLRVITNLIETRSNWKIDPRAEIRDGPPRGVGNHVSAEFNLIYRWHACVSKRDEDWINCRYQTEFDDKSPADVSENELLEVLARMERRVKQVKPAQRRIADQNGDNLERDPKTGRFKDDDLFEILRDGIEDPANAFGARQVPECLRAVEILGIRQARKWSVCTLNEFRKFFNLAPYTSFDEINPDKQIQDDLRMLYDTPDQVELYPGLLSEATKPKMLGSGLMPGFTISRAILSDAVSLVRGDRFYTHDFHPKALTNWGYAEIDSDPHVDYGCCSYKLIFTAFPQHFRRNSVYAHYPFMLPEQMRKILDKSQDHPDHENHHNYNYDRPESSDIRSWKEIKTFKGARYILERSQLFKVAWKEAIEFLMGSEARNFMLAGDGDKNEQSKDIMDSALYERGQDRQPDKLLRDEIKNFYLSKTRNLLNNSSKSSKPNTPKRVHESDGLLRADLVRDITNMTSVYFCAEMFLLPIKSDEYPHGVFTERELYLIFVAIFTCVFFDNDVVNSFDIHTKARAGAKVLGEMVERNVRSINEGRLVDFMRLIFDFHSREESSPLQNYGKKMIKRLLEKGKENNMTEDQLVHGHILGTAGGMVPNQGQQFAELLAFYLLDKKGMKHWPRIVEIANAKTGGEKFDDDHGEEELLRYVMEGSRLACASGVTREVSENTTFPAKYTKSNRRAAHEVDHECAEDEDYTIIENDKIHVHVQKGDKIFVNLWAASRDPNKYGDDADEVNLHRDLDKDYMCFGWGRHQCLGLDVIKISLTAMLRVVAQLPHLRPVEGPEGQVKKVPAGAGLKPGTAEGYWKYMTKCNDSYWPFPVGLKVQWESDWDWNRRMWGSPEFPYTEDDRAKFTDSSTTANPKHDPHQNNTGVASAETEGDTAADLSEHSGSDDPPPTSHRGDADAGRKQVSKE
ncbi:MAG: hypothetical protein Q9162_004243 [Coniocarpon cinnabarinum]